jgi:hypothetical protein
MFERFNRIITHGGHAGQGERVQGFAEAAWAAGDGARSGIGRRQHSIGTFQGMMVKV